MIRTDGMAIVDGYSVERIAAVVHGNVDCRHAADYTVRFLLTDSRQLLSPKETLFFALRTRQNDGHQYIGELLRKGVRSFVVEDIPAGLAREFPDACFIQVDSPMKALQRLAAFHRGNCRVPVLAITGSNGKTVVKEWICQLLGGERFVARNPKSYNSQIGVPLSVWLMTDRHELGVFEAGISQKGEMERLQTILSPETGIFTNIGPAHDEGFASRQEKVREKLVLFREAGTLIYCADHDLIHQEVQIWQKANPDVKTFTWGFSAGADLRVIRLEKEHKQCHVSLSYQGERMEFTIPFSDDASVENAMHCLAYLKHAGFGNDILTSGLMRLQPVAMRLEMKEGVNHSTIINDSYNADLHSLAIALDFLNSQFPHKRKTLILSDILQSGIQTAELYDEVQSLLASKGIDRLIGIGPAISSREEGFDVPARFYPDTESFIAATDFSEFNNEAILLKGARVFGFERLSSLLQQKDHETLLEVDLDDLIHNLNVFRSMLEPGVKTMGVVKAFSYGSGSVEVARMLQYHQVDYLAVAYADEGKELRDAGIHLPVIVMNPEVRSFETLIRHRLEPEIYGFPLLKRLIAEMDRSFAGNNSLPVHLKIDTGMHRLGFLPGEADRLAELVADNPRIRVASVFSHLAASEDPAHDSFTLEQIRIFRDVCHRMEELLGYPFMKHICNSSAISRFPDARFDMVRLGIGLYGVSGDPEIQSLLRHVSTFRSVVSQVKHIPAGETVGYGRAGVATGDMQVAIAPIGYADGLNRRLGNGKGRLLVNGNVVPFVGQISMDMCAVDVTGLKVKEGDEVIVFGPQLPVTGLADALDTIPYEVFTSVSRRVKRIYYQG